MEEKPSLLFSSSCPESPQLEKDQQISVAEKTHKRKYVLDPETEEQSSCLTELTLIQSMEANKKPKIKEEILTVEEHASTEKKFVSTLLTLFDETWARTSVSQQKYEEPLELKQAREEVAANFAKLRYNEQEEKRKGVSTNLTLDPWKIKKKLTGSDLGHLSRLLVPTILVQNYILSFLSKEEIEQVKNGGCEFDVWDCDTATKHNLVFKLWKTSKSYVFIDGWISGFVKTRDLKAGDMIGLFWDLCNSRFNFSVLQRS